MYATSYETALKLDVIIDYEVITHERGGRYDPSVDYSVGGLTVWFNGKDITDQLSELQLDDIANDIEQMLTARRGNDGQV